jgi:hypothetical protein
LIAPDLSIFFYPMATMLRLTQNFFLPSINDLFETNHDSMLNCNLPAIHVNLEKQKTQKKKITQSDTNLPLKPLKLKTSPLQNNFGIQMVNGKRFLIPEPKKNKAKKPIWIFEENKLQNRGRKGKEKEWQKKIKKFYKK